MFTILSSQAWVLKNQDKMQEIKLRKKKKKEKHSLLKDF